MPDLRESDYEIIAASDDEVCNFVADMSINRGGFAVLPDGLPAIFVVRTLQLRGQDADGVVCYPNVNSQLPMPVMVMQQDATPKKWAHEFGHFQGLGHITTPEGSSLLNSDAPRNIMWNNAELNAGVPSMLAEEVFSAVELASNVPASCKIQDTPTQPMRTHQWGTNVVHRTLLTRNPSRMMGQRMTVALALAAVQRALGLRCRFF